MSNMDEQYERMIAFQKALIDFNARLQSSMQELEKQHDNVSPHWQDEYRREYNHAWEPLETIMKHYMKSEGPGYVEFLGIKINATGRYLRGG